jgi:Protein of unknown function (DUF3168).
MSYPPVFKYAAASPAVTALLGSNPTRVYMFGMAPQNVAYPYAVWQMVGGAPENYLTNTPNIDAFTTQIDVYATTANAARACAMALRDAFEPYGHVTSWRGESRDDETQSYRCSFDVDWWVNR